MPQKSGSLRLPGTGIASTTMLLHFFLNADSGDQTQVLVCTAHALPSELSVSPAQDLHVLKRTSKKKTKDLR